MIALLLFIAFGLFFSYFATLNTLLVSVSFGSLSYEKIPLYVLIISSFAIGVVFASIFCFIKFIGVRLSVRKSEKELADSKQSSAEYLKKIHQLELENVKLKAENGHKVIDEDSI